MNKCQHRADSSRICKRGDEEEVEVAMEEQQGEVESHEQNSRSGICQPEKKIRLFRHKLRERNLFIRSFLL